MSQRCRASMSDETVAGRGTSLFGRSMSCGNEGDELAILPIAVFDLVSLLPFFPRSHTF
jgi:hypothetical protein